MAQQEQQVEDQIQQQEIAEDLGTVAPNLIAVLETDGIKAGVSSLILNTHYHLHLFLLLTIPSLTSFLLHLFRLSS